MRTTLKGKLKTSFESIGVRDKSRINFNIVSTCLAFMFAEDGVVFKAVLDRKIFFFYGIIFCFNKNIMKEYLISIRERKLSARNQFPYSKI